MASALAELRDRPFELLLEFERRSRVAASGRGQEGAHQEEWVGVAFRVNDVRLVAARQEVREVLVWPGVTSLPGAKPWLLGLANVRGQLLPITDLNSFFGGEPTVIGRSTRVVVVNHADIAVGLLVDEVRGFRRFVASEKTDELSGMPQGMMPFLAGAYVTDDDAWAVLGLHGLVESAVFLQAAR